MIKQRNQRARTNKNCEDDKSTISSSSKDTCKGIGTESNKNLEETIKNARRSLRIKQKQEKLNKRLIEEEKLNKIIKRIENDSHKILVSNPAKYLKWLPFEASDQHFVSQKHLKNAVQ